MINMLQKRAKVVVPLSKDDDPLKPGHNKEGKVYVFQGSTVQSWQITPEAHNCLNEINIDENLRREFLDNVWVKSFALWNSFY